jgi:hypothetical protein
MKALILILFLLVFPATAFSQQEIKLLSHNIIFGGLTSGVGAVINKKGDENWKKSFVRGCWQGSIGGLLNYSSKKTIYFIDKKHSLGYAIPARLIHSAGNSIIQNAAFNEPFLKNWNLEYGFLRFDFSLHSGKSFKARVLPGSLASTVMALPQGKFDSKTTLLTGVMTFSSDILIDDIHGTKDGMNYGRGIVYYSNSPRYLHIISHEIIHEYQVREFLVFNSYFKKEAAKLKNTQLKKFFTKYIYPDVPYFGLFYALEQTEPGPRFFRNYYEFEAEHFATNKYVPLH